ncbi:MAG: hypothetical protein OSP8Acid_01640 [uncultured Acidilobus sp. OSP8]|nr:MAG: hypothetical protein OSP8Acid_01640 [uncultured Acidilobus sp. OSP8]
MLSALPSMFRTAMLSLPGLLASLGTTLTSTDWNGPVSVPVVLMPLRNRAGAMT